MSIESRSGCRALTEAVTVPSSGRAPKPCGDNLACRRRKGCDARPGEWSLGGILSVHGSRSPRMIYSERCRTW
jgi:hypothetical protein